MTNQTNEIKIQLFDLKDGKKYTTCSSFAMAFLLDYCSVFEEIEDLIEEKVYGYKEMFVETSYELEKEKFKAYYISQDGIMKLAREFGRTVEPKKEDTLADRMDGLLDAAINTRINIELTNAEVKRNNEEMLRMFGR